MQYTVPMVMDAERNPAGFFCMHTTAGPLVLIFSSRARWERFADAASSSLRADGNYLGAAEFEAESMAEVIEKLRAADATLSLQGAKFVPDSAGVYNEIVEFLEGDE